MATSVIMPLMSAATLSGIIRRPGESPLLWAIRKATGMKIATTAVELISEPSAATDPISITIRRDSPEPALALSQSPRRRAMPVRVNPAPITNKAAIRTIEGSLNPANASFMVMTPVNGIKVSMMRATASMRGRFITNMATDAASMSKMRASWRFMRHSNEVNQSSRGPLVASTPQMAQGYRGFRGMDRCLRRDAVTNPGRGPEHYRAAQLTAPKDRLQY